MTFAFALLGSVVCVCGASLVAWRWWLAHAAQLAARKVEFALATAQAEVAKAQAKVRDLDKEWAELAALKERLKRLEYAGGGR